MASPMSLREAVEIVRGGPDSAGVNLLDHAAVAARDARYHRARLIVDAAVRWHEARCAEWDSHGLKPGPLAIDEWYKLRALERGEEIK